MFNVFKVVLFALGLLPFMVNADPSLEKVSLQLNWKYQFEFAGYIAAKEKGFYEEVGLDVELIEYHNEVDLLNDVLSRKANYGVSDYSVFIRDKKIVPVRVLATYIQRSPLVLLTSKDIASPNQLLGKTIMIPEIELENSAAALMFSHFYLNHENTHFVTPSFDVDDLINGRADAISAYSSNEPFQLKQKGAEFNVINPADYGYVSPVGNLYTSHDEAQEYPARTKKFLQASTKGWEYALKHQEEIIQLIYEKYKPNKSLEALRFEANELYKLIMPDTIKLGAINHQARINFVQQLKRSHLLDEDQHLVVAEQDEDFSLAQILYLNEKRTITMCIDPNWLPFEAIENGKHVGIAADVFHQLKQQLPIPITLIPTTSWAESIEKAKSRECDILSLAANTPSRTEYMNFTSPYLTLPVVLITRMDTFFINDLSEVKDKKIGIVKDYAMAEQLRKEMPELNIVDVDSIEDGLERVQSGELFGYIDNLMVTANYIQQHFTGELKVSARIDDVVKLELAIATRKDEPLLNEVFQTLISNLKKSELQEIYNKWVAVDQDPIVDYSVLIQLFTLFFFVSLAYLYYYLKLKKLNAQLQTLSTTDTLTGLYNRLKMDTVLVEKKTELDRYDTPFSVILIDVDHFKRVNDEYGHQIGDHTLRSFASIIEYNVRASDYVGRWGGEEFLIICPNTSLSAAGELANKLLKKVNEYDFAYVKNMSFSAGVADFTQQHDIQTSLRNVDNALYLAKESGRNKVVVHAE